MPCLILAAVVVVILLVVFRERYPFWKPFRGAARVKSVQQANRLTEKRGAALETRDATSSALRVRLGGLALPLEVLNQPLMIFGVPGSGKTSLLNLLLPSLMPLFHLQPGRTRFVILDVKNESLTRLHQIIPDHVPIHVLNPLDARAVALDWPTIFATRADQLQLAHAICPPIPGDSSPYFRDWARQFLWGVCHVFQKFAPAATRPWRLFDLLAVCSDKTHLRNVLALDDETRSLFRAALDPKTKSSGDVFSTLRSVIQGFADAALSELDAKDRFVFDRFLREDGVLVLAVPPKGAQAVLPLHSVALRRLIEEAQTNSHPADRLVLILDEIALLERTAVDSLVKATCVGRSHGIHVIAATQSLELLESALSAEKAHAFLASCATTVGFRCASRKTAEYVVGRFGQQEGIMLLGTKSSNSPGFSSITEHFVTRPSVMAEHLLHLPLADPVKDCLQFYVVCPTFESAFVTSTFVKETRLDPTPEFPNVLPRKLTTNSLRPLTESELAELGLPRRSRP